MNFPRFLFDNFCSVWYYVNGESVLLLTTFIKGGFQMVNIVPSSFKVCPVCGGEVLYGTDNCFCVGCKRIFVYDASRKVWKGDMICDIAYSDPETSTLSNMFPHEFSMDTKHGPVTFASMEAFFRALTWNGPRDSFFEEIGKLHGYDAWRVRYVLPDWRKEQTVYWDGTAIARQSEEYSCLLEKAYDSMFEQSMIFRLALQKTSDKILMHTMGEKDPTKTLLTPDEYIKNLIRERNRL